MNERERERVTKRDVRTSLIERQTIAERKERRKKDRRGCNAFLISKYFQIGQKETVCMCVYVCQKETILAIYLF